MSRETSQALAITRVRLLGFHNFLDETIELSASRGEVRTHLFLVGDNGSGKSTVLDAVHLVLTGADVELNAAARTGARPRGPSGRTLAGIVLRQRDDRVRDGHAIAYAAIELASAGERWTIGVGLGATTLDALVTRWGFVHPGALSSVPLSCETEGGERPRTSDELAAAIGRGSVHARIGDYRARVASHFFGGEVGYERATRLWSIAKAYREMASSTREPSEIVTRFLPPPRSDAIDAIRTSVAQLDELERDGRALEEQRARVAGIVACQQDVARLRRAQRELSERLARARVDQRERELADHDARREALREELAAATERCARAEEHERRVGSALAAAESGEIGAWVAARDGALAVRDARRSELARAESARDGTQRHEEAAREALERTERELARSEERAFRALALAVEGAVRADRLLPIAADAAQRSAAESLAGAHEELDAALVAARTAQTEAVVRLRDAERTAEQAESSAPATPDEISELRRAGIEALPLSLAVEPRADADPTQLATLEALVPSEVWGTLITREEHVPEARVVLGAHPGARLVVREGSAPLPSWVEGLLAPPTSVLGRRAHATLALELATEETIAPPDALGGARLRGVYVRGRGQPSRLGERARASAQQAAAAARATALAEARSTCARRIEAARRASADVALVERALEALRRLGSAELGALRAARDHARTAVVAAAAGLASAAGVRDAAREALEAAERTLAMCRAPTAEVAEHAARRSELETAVQAARAARVTALEARAGMASRASELEQRRDALDAEVRALRARLASASLAPTVEGARVTPEELEREGEQLRREERARLDELFGDGSRGIVAIDGVRRFACVADEEDAPQLTDASGRSPAGVLAELDGKLADVQSAVSERTRDVFDGVVMGSLAGQLQREVEQLHATITGINEQLGRASYGGVRYAFRIAPRADRAELVSLVRRMSVLDPASRSELRRYVEERRSDLAAPGDEPPSLLDYRKWFDVRLVTRKQGEADSPWSRERAATGSGGEQGVPSHLVVFALARLTFEGARARVMPLLLDEAFHGIDATRRESLLGFAGELGLQLVVATPDQDGLVRGMRSTTTLFVVKDEHDDVRVVPYHYYDHASGAQTVMSV